MLVFLSLPMVYHNIDRCKVPLYLEISSSSFVIAMFATTCHSAAAITSVRGPSVGSIMGTITDTFSEMSNVECSK